jgi:hypothetical protein
MAEVLAIGERKQSGSVRHDGLLGFIAAYDLTRLIAYLDFQNADAWKHNP